MTSDVANAFKIGRVMSGMTVEATAQLLGMTTRDVHRYESGTTKNPNPALILQAAKAFNSTPILYAYLEKDPVFHWLIGNIPRFECNEDTLQVLQVATDTALYARNDISGRIFVLAEMLMNAKKETALSGQGGIEKFEQS